MTTSELFTQITSKPKWYAGIKTYLGTFYTPTMAHQTKAAFKKGTLKESTIEKILNHHGYVKNETTWTKQS